eukprot:TRINITY_DN4377_c0_g1_i1.p1 TRINITY_DN4377_c0_g1~~TRINITY_DN4377_c0_g1_i1.p1  ORF type:complete len:613 (+),score=91.40 TRINITY_DN4377_c0_g1_i1:30-1841(+)
MYASLGMILTLAVSYVVQNGTRVVVNPVQYPYVHEPQNPAVASTFFGGIVVVWEVPAEDKIFGQRFDRDGTRAEAPFIVGEGYKCRNPVVLGMADGAFLVIWEAMHNNKWVFNISSFEELLFVQRRSDPLKLPEGVTGRSPTLIHSYRGFRIVYHQTNVTSDSTTSSIVSSSFDLVDFSIYKDQTPPITISGTNPEHTPIPTSKPKVSELDNNRLFCYVWETVDSIVIRLLSDWGEIDTSMRIPNAKNPDLNKNALVYEQSGEIYLHTLASDLSKLESAKVTDGITGIHTNPKVAVVSKFHSEPTIVVSWVRQRHPTQIDDTEVMVRTFNVSLEPLLESDVGDYSVSRSVAKETVAVASWGDSFEKGPPGYVVIWRSIELINDVMKGFIAAKFFPVIPPPPTDPPNTTAPVAVVETRSPSSMVMPVAEGEERLYKITIFASKVTYLEANNGVNQVAETLKTLLLHSNKEIYVGYICLTGEGCNPPNDLHAENSFRLEFVGTSTRSFHWLNNTLGSHLMSSLRECFPEESDIVLVTELTDVTPVTLSTSSKIGIVIVLISLVLVLCIIVGCCYTRYEKRVHVKLEEEDADENDPETENRELEEM